MVMRLRLSCNYSGDGLAGTNAATPGPRRIALAEILQGSAEVVIEHADQDYRLRLTSNGKLLLTK